MVAHPSAIVAESLASALSRYPWIIPIGTATTVAEAVRRSTGADVAVVDDTMPSAIELAGLLRARGVRVAIIGVQSELADDLRISPDAPLASLAAALVPRASGDEGIGRPLSPRERQILALAARGLPAKQVARQLGISPKTVEQHKTRIFAKLGVQNQTAAVSVAFRHHPSFADTVNVAAAAG